MSILQYLMVALIALQVGDWLTTVIVISRGGYEANGVLNRYRAWLKQEGHDGRWLWLTSVKSLVIAACLSIAIANPPVGELVLMFQALCVVVYLGVVAHNMTQIK